MMYLTGTADYLMGGMDASGRRVAFDRTSADAADDQYLITIKGAEHMAFSDNPRGITGEALQRDPAHHQWILAATTNFWNAYLRGDQKAREWLQSDALPALSNQQCMLEHK